MLVRQQAALVEPGLRDHVDAGVRQPVGGEHAAQVRLDVLLRAVRDAPEDDGDRDVPRGGLVQQLPRHGVRVAVGGGGEDPQVRRLQELAGQRAVGVRHGVDVRGVHDRDAGGQGRLGHERHGVHGAGVGLHGAGGLAPVHRDPGQVREHARAGEPVGVLGVVEQQRLARGGAQGGGTGHLVPHEGVHERGLARAGGSADHREQRGVERVQAGQDVVVDLVPGALALGPVRLGGGGGEGQLDGVQVRAHAAHSGVDADAGDRPGRCGVRIGGFHRVIVSRAGCGERVDAPDA